MSSKDEFFAKIDEVLQKAPESRHSYYQLKYFVLGKEPTTQAQMWQCLRELESRKETINTLQLQIEDTKDEIDLMKIEAEKVAISDDAVYLSAKLDDIYKRERVIKTKRLKRKVESLLSNINRMEKKLEFEMQEANFFMQAFEALEKIEPLKDYDDYEAQKELWEAKITEEINLRSLMRQPIPPDLLKTALSLHNESEVKARVINILETNKALMKLSVEENNVRQINNK